MIQKGGHPERSDGSAVDLRSKLRSLRAADEHEAPAFDAVVARVRRSRALVWHPPRAAIAAALVFIAASALVYRAARPQPLTVPAEVLALSTWRPLTDVLLETPNRQFLTDMPDLDATTLPVPRTPALEPIETDTRFRW
jgi:hypothetical protein